MKTKFYHLLLTALGILVFSINSQAQISETRTLPPFDKIEAGGIVNISILPGETHSVRITAHTTPADQIYTEVDGTTLEISSGKIDREDVIRVEVIMPELKELSLSGVSTAITSGVFKTPVMEIELTGASKAAIQVETDKLVSEVSGASELRLQGKSTIHESSVTGASTLQALELATTTTDVEISGVSNAHIFAENLITADISGMSKLRYFDDPDLKTISKSGIYKLQLTNSEKSVGTATKKSGSGDSKRDSVTVRVGNMEVKVYDGKDETRVSVGGREIRVDSTGNVRIGRSESKPRYNGHWAGFEMGLNGFHTSGVGVGVPAGYEFLEPRLERSINARLNFLEQNLPLVAHNLGLTTGLGIEWNNYFFQHSAFLSNEGTELTGGYNQLADADYTKSKLVTFYLNLPLFLEYQTNRHSGRDSFHLGAGLEGGWKLHSYTKQVYMLDNKKRKDREPGEYFINPFKVDFITRVGWGKINLYANYALIPLFKKDKGPEINPFRIGITVIGL